MVVEVKLGTPRSCRGLFWQAMEKVHHKKLVEGIVEVKKSHWPLNPAPHVMKQERRSGIVDRKMTLLTEQPF